MATSSRASFLKVTGMASRGRTLKVLLYSELKTLKGISFTREHLHTLEKDKKFPQRIKLGTGRFGRIAWVESEIDGYIRGRMAARRGG